MYTIIHTQFTQITHLSECRAPLHTSVGWVCAEMIVSSSSSSTQHRVKASALFISAQTHTQRATSAREIMRITNGYYQPHLIAHTHTGTCCYYIHDTRWLEYISTIVYIGIQIAKTTLLSYIRINVDVVCVCVHLQPGELELSL